MSLSDEQREILRQLETASAAFWRAFFALEIPVIGRDAALVKAIDEEGASEEGMARVLDLPLEQIRATVRAARQ